MNTKICRTCKIEKSPTEFYPEPRAGSGLTGSCKQCTLVRNARSRNNPERKQRSKEWRDKYRRTEKGKAARHWDHIARKYGLTSEQYEHLTISQNGRCKICGALPKAPRRFLDVDHSHITGKVRALLCNLCNQGIGLLRDDPEITEKAARYLRSFS